jgi:hypothetical protein
MISVLNDNDLESLFVDAKIKTAARLKRLFLFL